MGPHAVGDLLLVGAAPGVPAPLYAATATVLFRSTDGGQTWAALTVPPAVTAFAADRGAPGRIYAGTSFSGGVFNPEAGAVYASTDAGAHWSAGAGLRAAVLSLVVDAQSPATLFAGTSDGGWRSTDSGANWSRVGSTLSLSRVAALAAASRPSRIYAGGDGGVFASSDAGATWTLSAAGLPSEPVTGFAVDPIRPALYASTNGAGVFATTDGGASWHPASLGLADLHVFQLAADPSRSGVLYGGTNAGVFRSTDGGASWRAVNEGLPSPFIVALAVDPSSPGTVYASVLGPGLFQATFATRAPRGLGFR
jgi:photosystem II stability/assembly factor-like uncharacterized protein